jgi:hypothetical protein
MIKFENFKKEEFKKVMYIPFAVIITSIIIIIITTNVTNSNGLSALLGGYSGLMLGILFVTILSWVYTKRIYVEMLPVLIISGFLIFYLTKYFDKISKGEVSSYYSSFSVLSSIFLFTQVTIIFSSIFEALKNSNEKLFSKNTSTLLGLFGVINFLIVSTIGIILQFYSTDG